MSTPHCFARPLALTLAATCTAAAWAQPPCDSLHTATFTHADLGAYAYGFSPVLPDQAALLSAEWGFLGSSYMDFSLAQQPQTLFPGAGEYVACLRALLQSDAAGICESVHCAPISIPVDSTCADVSAAFTISVQGGAIQFMDQSSALAPILAYTWDLGDGTVSAMASPTHTYPGNGPYEACLTVSTATCTATVCNWIYLGPPDVPCGTLLQPAIGVIQFGNTIAAFDQSITSGMEASVSWDFGDGGTATGSPVIHTYAWDGYYEVCGQVRLWGPLTPDTCTAAACEPVHTYAATGIGGPAEGEALRAFPMPFDEVLTVAGVPAGARWQLLDLLGRPCRAGRAPASGPLHVPGHGLPPGSYVLRVEGPGQAMHLRAVKR